MRRFSAPLFLLVLSTVFSTLTFAAQADRISGSIDAGQRVSLSKNIQLEAKAEFDQGLVDPSLKLGYMTLLTLPTASQRKAIDQLLADQQNPRSKSYHKWLTPEQYADRFGLTQADITKLKSWLTAQGFTVLNVARARNTIHFSGTAAQAQAAFQTEIHHFNVNGELHYANATPPSVPAALSGVVTAVRGLNDFRPKAKNLRKNQAIQGFYDSTNFGDLAAPGDIATIYDIKALYTAGIDGTGIRIAVGGQTDVYLADLTEFRTGFGLSALSCTTNSGTGVITACNDSHFKYVLVSGSPDPGVQSGDLGESDLDLEWSGAIAKGAQIIFVNSTNAFESYYDAIDNNRAQVISLSYGICEQGDQGFIDQDEAELALANTEGITFLNSTGDSGAGSCDPNGSNLSTQGLAISYPASSQYVTGVGGSSIPLANFTATYWGTSNGTDGGTALSYIPEGTWNDAFEIGAFCIANPSNTFCTGNGINSAQSAQTALGISSTGGGASNCATVNVSGVCTAGFPRPSYQSSLTVAGQATGGSAVRFSPDVAMFASPNFPGYIFCVPQNEWGVSSSTASTCASGISNSVENDASIIGGTSASAPVFAGVVALLNQYLQGSSSTGLGNINPTLYTLATSTTSGAFNHINSGTNQVYCQSGTPASQPAALRCPVAVAPATLGLFGFDSAVFDSATHYNLVTGLGSPDVNKLAIAWAATLPGFTLGASTNTLTAVAGHASNASTITVTAENGFTGSVAFTCTGLPAGATCTFTPTSSTTSTSLTIQTASNTAAATTTVTVQGTSGAATASTTVSLVVSATDQSFTIAPVSGSVSVVQGQPAPVVFNITPDPTNGFTGTLNFSSSSCSGLPAESHCTFSPTSVPVNNTATTVNLTISTTAPTAQLYPPMGRANRYFLAAFLPGLLGLFFTVGSRKRVGRGLRMMSFIFVLGLSTMWLGSCGGSNNSTNKDPGTPAGSSTVTVTATTGGSSPVTATTTVTLVVTAK